MFFIDIAVPRDIDPAVNEIDNAFLYDIDDLQQVIDANLKERMKEAHRAEEIVDSEVQAFCTRMQSREVVPTIVQLRDTLEKLRRDEIERNRRHLKDLSPGAAGGCRSDHAVAREQDPPPPHRPAEGNGARSPGARVRRH